MSAERRTACRERARSLGRAALTVGFAAATFAVWYAVGLPHLPGLGLRRPGATLHRGALVFMAAAPRAPVRALPHASTSQSSTTTGAAAPERRLGARRTVPAAAAPASLAAPVRGAETAPEHVRTVNPPPAAAAAGGVPPQDSPPQDPGQDPLGQAVPSVESAPVPALPAAPLPAAAAVAAVTQQVVVPVAAALGALPPSPLPPGPVAGLPPLP